MSGSPHILTILASSPVQIQMDITDSDIDALGINLVTEMNPQRYTAHGKEEVAGLTAFLAQNSPACDICSLALYIEPPLEAVEIQPFSRPMKGHHCFFSQQGELPEIHNRDLYAIGQQWPVSCTDQERAFCVLLERVLTLWQEGRPDHETRLALMADYAARLDRLGAHNFKYWDGDFLFAYRSEKDEFAPISYCQLQGERFEFGDKHRFLVTSDYETEIVVVGDPALINHEASECLAAGSVACFQSGKLIDLCEPVTFWTDD